MAERPPVTDWATDFDHTDQRWIENPFPIWDELRKQCPIAHTQRYGGVYLPTRYEDVRAIAYDTGNFSSRRPVIRENPPDVPLPSPPITSDPPHHRPARMLLLPAFSPQVIERLIPRTRAICNELLDRIVVKGECDAAAEYTQHIPVRVIAYMLGVPEENGDLFRRWIHVFLEDTIADRENGAGRLLATAQEMDDFFRPYAEARCSTPGNDLISFLVQSRHGGEPLTERHLFGALRLILIAGIDTTWSAIGASLWHLGRTPADRDRLVAEPDLIPTAVEEFLRAYSPVTMARQIANDTQVAGCPMKAGEFILLSFPAANRDPDAFEDADKVIIDRKDNRHAAFGLGIHRCIGSNLARMEITVALQEWLKRVPRFHLKEADVAWSRGPVRGPRSLPFGLGG
jgi:cytochrome P450